jgi:hypothetical protein
LTAGNSTAIHAAAIAKTMYASRLVIIDNSVPLLFFIKHNDGVHRVAAGGCSKNRKPAGRNSGATLCSPFFTCTSHQPIDNASASSIHDCSISREERTSHDASRQAETYLLDNTRKRNDCFGRAFLVATRKVARVAVSSSEEDVCLVSTA